MAPSFPPLVSSSPFFRIFASRALSASAAAGARFEIAAYFLPSILPLLSFAPRANSAKVVTIWRTRTKTETETQYDITGQRQTADRNKTSLGRLEMSDFSFAHYHSFPHSARRRRRRLCVLARLFVPRLLPHSEMNVGDTQGRT